MDISGTFQPALLGTIGLWFGFILSLMIFSLIVGDNGLARLGQHIVVGAISGYAVVLAWQQVLRPRLFIPLSTEPAANTLLWLPLLLGGTLFTAGLLRSLAADPDATPPQWRRAIYLAGSLVTALMLGIAIAVSLIGVLQGTLIPQLWRTAVGGFIWSATPFTFIMGLLTVAVTTGTVLQLQVNPARDLADQPVRVRTFLQAWMGIGKRALWLAAGVVFARLMLARFSLLIARLGYFLDALQSSNIWQ